MEFADYAQALATAQRSVPDWREGDMQEAQLATARVQPALMQAQTNQVQSQTQLAGREAAYKDQRRTTFQAAVASLGTKPTPEKLYRIGVDYPEFAGPINDIAKNVGFEQRQAMVKHWAPLQALIQNGRTDAAIAELDRHTKAAQAAGEPEDEHTDELREMLASGDKSQIKTANAILYGLISAVNPDTAAANIGKRLDSKTHVITQGSALVEDDGTELYSRAPAEANALDVGVYDDQGHRVGTQLIPNGGRGGAASGYATPGYGSGSRSDGGQGGGDVSRLINSDAGGGYVPEGVKTLGQFVGFGKSLNARGAKSSSAGTYQINGTTMAEFAPKAIGPGWKDAPFNANTQEKVGEAIFNWAKTQNNPAVSLRNRWVSLSPQEAAQVVQGTWQQARGVIAQGETGGGAGASASAGAGVPGYIGPVASASGTASGDPNATGDAYLASLSPGRRNLLRMINEGRQAAPKPGTKFGEQLSEDLARAYPGADLTTFAAKQQTRKDFTGSGKAAVALASYNRFAAHLNSAWGIHQRLGGPNLGPLSGLAAGVVQSFSPKDVNAYNTEIDGIQGEFQKLTKLGVANEGEANRLIHAARAAQSSEGRAGALEAMASLVAGAYQPQVAQWRSAFPGQPLPVDVSPSSKAVINNVIHNGRKALPMGGNGAPVGSARGFNGNGQQPARSAGGFRILKVRPK